MTHKPPKEFERSPIILGLELKKVAYIGLCTILFVATIFKNFIVAMAFPLLLIIYLTIDTKFPKKGEFINFIKFSLEPKHIYYNKTLKTILTQKKIK